MENNVNTRFTESEDYKDNMSNEDESKYIILKDFHSGIESFSTDSNNLYDMDKKSTESLGHTPTVRVSSGIHTSILILILIISVGMTLVFTDFIKSSAMIDLTIHKMILVLAILGNICLLVMLLLRKNTNYFLQSAPGDSIQFGLIGRTLRVSTQTILLQIFAVGTLSYHILMISKVFKSLHNCQESSISLCMYLLLALFCILQLIFIWKFINMKCASFFSRTLMSFVFGANINVYLCVLIEETITVLKESGASFPNITESCEILSFNRNETDNVDEASHYIFPFVIEYSLMAVQLLYNVWDISHYDRINKLDIPNSYLELVSTDEEISLLRLKGPTYTYATLKRMCGLYIGLIINIPLCIVTFVKGVPLLHLIRNVLALVSLVTHFVICVLGLVLNRNARGTNRNQTLRSSDLMLYITAGSVSFFHLFRMVAILNYVSSKGTSESSEDNVILLVLVAIFHLLSTYSQTLLLRSVSRIRLSSIIISKRDFLNLQICSYVLVTNVSFWTIDSFIPHHLYDSSPVRDIPMDFFGNTEWILTTNILLPMLIYYRLHCVFLCLDLLKKP